jgi:NAD(P)-dependent dehydrogenase (short-subunit alcohol dehydrogenase family)
MFNFENQVIMISGAAGNIGQVLARAFQDAGGKLALVDRGRERLESAFPDLVSAKDHLLVDCADVMEEDAVAESLEESLEHFGRIDVLVNTVGGFHAGTPTHETPLDTWDFMLKLNARSVFIICKQVIPIMLQQGSGKIVNFAARPGLQGKSGMSAYSASKAAVFRLTETMAAEYREHDINVNCVIPGTMDTPANRENMPEADFNTWVEPASLAQVILFLSSPAAKDVHGAAIPVYGKS